MACTNCGNDWCTGCTSSLPHVAGDPYDPSDDHWKDRPAPRPAPDPETFTVYTGYHVAGDPYDPADSKYDTDSPRRQAASVPAPAAESTPEKPRPPEPWSEPCPQCAGAAIVTGRYTEQGAISSYLYQDMVTLRCTACAHTWEEQEGGAG